MVSKIVCDCSSLLCRKKLKIAFGESATAGRMAAEFALTPDSGKILLGGLVCYDACIKQRVLKVPQSLIDTCTPESAEVTQAVAEGLQKIMDADIFVAVTGLTTPGGSESAEKPVGTIFLHILHPEGSLPLRFEFKGDAESIILQAIDAAAAEVMKVVQ